MKVVSVKNLSFSYDGEHPTLRDVSFDVETGSYVAVIGHNGSGKSTLAKILMGLLGDWKGEVTLFDLPLTDKNLVELRKKIGIVFQNPDNQFVGSTVSDDIAFGLENRQIPHEDMQGIIEKYAKETGMYEFLEKLVRIALPRIRDFKGIAGKFDGRGNYTLGIEEQIIFPEINIDAVDRIQGMNITFVTSAATDEEGFALLKEFGLPFRNAKN